MEEKKPEPSGKNGGLATKNTELAQEKFKNFIHIILDKTDSQSYYHALSVVNKVANDVRLASFDFKKTIYTKEDVFIPEYAKCNKEQLKSFEGIDVVRLDFLEKLGGGDIVFATGGEKVLQGFSEIATQNDDAFFYFGATKKLSFKKEKANFDLLTIESNSITEEDLDDDNIISVSECAIFYDESLFVENLEKKAEHDYTFIVLPFLTGIKKQEIQSYRKTQHSSIGLQNLFQALKMAYKEGEKIVIVSNFVKDVDFETEIFLKGLIESAIKHDVKVKFIHHDYIKDNKIPEIINHLKHNQNDRVILPSSHFSEINAFAKNVENAQIFWFKNLQEEFFFSGDFGILTKEQAENLEKMSFFSESEIEALKKYKSEEIHNKLISGYIANSIVESYVEDTQNRDARTEIEEEELLEEEVEEVETDEGFDEEIDEEEEVEEKAENDKKEGETEDQNLENSESKKNDFKLKESDLQIDEIDNEKSIEDELDDLTDGTTEEERGYDFGNQIDDDFLDKQEGIDIPDDLDLDNIEKQDAKSEIEDTQELSNKQEKQKDEPKKEKEEISGGMSH